MWLCDLNVAVMKHVQVSLLYPRKEVTFVVSAAGTA